MLEYHALQAREKSLLPGAEGARASHQGTLVRRERLIFNVRSQAVDDLLNDFLIESNENLERLDQEIVELESKPDDLENLKSVFRTIHTVKGSCGFLGLTRMERVSHAAEDVLGNMRDGDLPVTPDTIGPVLEAIDTIKLILTGLEAEAVEP